jgi:2-polyprenyl-6-methoxyphenol hydroxylase-like FAD-dependent oxidoreductase
MSLSLVGLSSHRMAKLTDIDAGAGIGGLALAMSLHKRGVAFTLYEGAKEYSVVGFVRRYCSHIRSVSV